MASVILCWVLIGAADGDVALELAQSEMDFAAHSVREDMKAAFLAFLAEDAVVFRPGPVNGKEWMGSRPVPAGQLSWHPHLVETASSGDMGYTTGPYEYRVDENRSGYGTYMSIWKKQTDGSWRVAMDAGIVHEKMPVDPSRKPQLLRVEEAGGTGREDTLRSLDAQLPFNPGKDHESSLSSRIVMLRNGLKPLQGKAAALAYQAEPRQLTRETMTLELASSGDFGYSLAALKSDGEVRAHQIRIWRLEGGHWQLVMDLFFELPQP